MINMDFIAREKEIKKLQKILTSRRSEFVAVYGRRRVGKTFLIRKVFNNNFTFHATAIANVNKKLQLVNFYTSLKKYQGKSSPEKLPKTWFDAFQQLMELLEKSKAKRKVVFLDELPWFDNPKSDFVPSLEHFWNHWASARTDIVLVTCGSAASWMINKLINHKGGLHNRVTTRIKLEPFTLKETETFLKIKNPAIDRYQIIQLYMVMGGIPFYLYEVAPEWSAVQNIEQICFASDGLLRSEFNNLFKALFSKAERHISIVKALSTKTKGLTRQEILKLTKLPNNGKTTKLLNELEESGFIRKYIPFQKKKRNSLYQLIDFYTLFYLRFIQPTNPYDQNTWINRMETSAYRAWSGYAFEQVCLYHIQQIKEALGIAGIYTQTFSWKSTFKEPKQKGAQIDILIDRRDHVINLCEVKFSLAPFTITKAYATQLQQKISTFKAETGTNKAIHLTLITTYGLTQNAYAMSLVRNSLDMNVLFD